jgi:signal transduction histidine kinase/ligand-binding sensor domain-containing protein
MYRGSLDTETRVASRIERRSIVSRCVHIMLTFAVVLCFDQSGFALDLSLDIRQYAHTAWKTRDGFTPGAITAIEQTPDGYLWLGTELGLVRFDGVRAVRWQPPTGEHLPSNYITKLMVSRDGTLWIATSSGLASWKSGQLTNYPEVAGHASFTLVQDREGTIWFGANEPGRLCAIHGGKLQCYGAGSFGPQVVDLYEDRNSNLWVSAVTGVWRWKPGLPKQQPFSRGVVEANALIEDDNGTLLLATNGGLKRLVEGRIQSYVPPGVSGAFRPNRLFRSSDGALWVGTFQGLLRFRQGRTDKVGVADGLSGDQITSIFEDREGDVWVGTNGGLDRFREYALPTISRSEGLSSSDAYSIQAGRDGSVWIGTSSGLNRWTNGRVTVYGMGSRNEPTIGGEAAKIAASGQGSIQSLGQDDQARLLVSTSGGPLYFDGSRFVQIAGVSSIYDSGGITGAGNGKVWIADWKRGLFYLRPGNAAQPIPWSQFGQKNYGASSLLADRLSGGLWLGFPEGGIAYFKDGQVRRSYTTVDGLGGGRVVNLRFGGRDELWAATEGGLSRVKDGQVTTLTSKNGLPCDQVYWSIEDDDHFVWLYMPCGLVRVARSELDAWASDSKRTILTTVFDASDGVGFLGSAMGYGPPVTKSPDGRIWFVTRDGVNVIDPPHLPFNTLPPPVHVEQVTADRKTYDASSNVPGDSSSHLRLPPLARDLEIDYTALSFVAPEKNRFRVKLEGRDRDWQDLGNRGQAFYNDLPPGNYRFHVSASNNSGVWNEAGTFLDFSVAPAYYQTNWFRVSCVIAFMGMLWGLYRLRLHQLAQQFNMRLEERVNERTRIARELHDTLLQSFQGLLLRFQSVLKVLPERPVEAEQRLERALDQATKAIAEARDSVQGLRLSAIETNDLVQSITTIGEELSAGGTDPNSPAIHVEVGGAPRNLKPIVRDEVYRVAGEALRNAFRHAQALYIVVEIRYDEREFRLRVHDDGKGIDEEAVRRRTSAGHFGLHGMHERAEMVGGRLDVWSKVDSGTELQLTIPAAIAYAVSPRRAWLSQVFSTKGPAGGGRES